MHRRPSLPLLPGLLVGALLLLLASATPAPGFGFVTKWGRGGSAPGEFNHPEAVATDRAGHVYAVRGDKTDRRYRVLKFSSRGRLVDRWALPRPRYGRLPGGAATDAAGNVYVAVDRWIEKFTATGTLLTRWKDPAILIGSPPHLFEPQVNGIAIDAAGSVYVTGGDRITFVSETKTWPARSVAMP